jgi:small-conductance mechanosensitive channel
MHRAVTGHEHSDLLMFLQTAARPIAALLCLLWLSNASAAEEEQSDVDAPTSIDSAPVIIDGVELFRVSGAASYPSAQRAQAVRERILALARERRVPVNAIGIKPRDNRIDIVAGDRHIVAVVEHDAEFEGAPASSVAELRVAQIRQAIERYRFERQPDQLARSGLIAFLATAATALALFLLLRAFRRLFELIERRYRSRVHSVTIQAFEVVRAENIWRAVNGFLSGLRLLLVAALIYVYLAVTLRQFPQTRGFAEGLVDLVVQPLKEISAAILQYIPKLAFLVVLVFVVRYLLKLTNLFARAVSAGRVPLRGFDPDWAQPTYNIVRVVIILLAIVVAYPYLPGSGSAAFQGLSIFAGLMLSLGASSAMASLIAGYTVTDRRAFRVGDRITVGEFTGEVTEVRLLVTHLRTPKNEEVVVPNSVVLQSHIVNYSKLAKSPGLILHTTVGIGYETPWRQVEAMLLLAAKRTDGVLQDPHPFVLEKSLGDFAVTYELNVYVDGAQHIPQRYAALHRNILDVFNEHGVQIMTPAYEGDPEQPKVVPKDLWYSAPATETASEQRRDVDPRRA